MHTANCFELAPAFEATARATAPDTGCSLTTDRFLEFDFLLSDAMCLVPVKFGFEDRTILEADGGYALHLAPASTAILPGKSAPVSRGSADHDGFHRSKPAQNFEAQAAEALHRSLAMGGRCRRASRLEGGAPIRARGATSPRAQ